MTYREKFFQLKKIENKYLNQTSIKSLLIDNGGFKDFFDLLNHFDEQIKDENKLNNQLEKLTFGEPLQYILGYAYFVNSNYKVTPDVLIPRQETEQLAVGTMTKIVKLFGKDPKIKIVDIGTGSGILGIYLKEYFTKSTVICTDISLKALEIAKINAKEHNVQIDFRSGDMLEPISNESDISVIISNPPYIRSKETVSEQTLKYEPHLALFANPATKFYQEILTSIDKQIVNDNKFLFAFEIEEDMQDELTALLEEKYSGLFYQFDKDIYGKVRFLYIINNKELLDALN